MAHTTPAHRLPDGQALPALAQRSGQAPWVGAGPCALKQRWVTQWAQGGSHVSEHR